MITLEIKDYGDFQHLLLANTETDQGVVVTVAGKIGARIVEAVDRLERNKDETSLSS